MRIKKGMGEEYGRFCEVNSHDGCSYSVIKFIHQWADLMEKLVEQEGKSVDECVEDCSFRAGGGKLSGTIWGYARSAIARFWEYGDEFQHHYDAEREEMERRLNSRCTTKSN